MKGKRLKNNLSVVVTVRCVILKQYYKITQLSVALFIQLHTRINNTLSENRNIKIIVSYRKKESEMQTFLIIS